MNYRFIKITGMFALLLSTVFSEDSVSADDELLIREARQSFNDAIKEQKIELIVQFSAPDYHIITGRSAQSHGKDAVRGLWQSYFAGAPDAFCQRDIRELRVNTGWGLAEELGDWNCHGSSDGESVHASGVYAAKWQRSVTEKWLIQSEVFTTMNCNGPETGCRPPDPIE